MKKSKFTEAQIVFAIKQSETGVQVAEICRKMGISEATFYNRKKKYGGLGVAELRELRQLKDENSKLKQMVADLSLDKQMLQDVIKKAQLRCIADISFGVLLSVSQAGRQAVTQQDTGDCRNEGSVRSLAYSYVA
jgi:putative transposase